MEDQTRFSGDVSRNYQSRAEAIWTADRRRIKEWLSLYAPSLSELYEGALRLQHEYPIPGRTRMIAHAVREIGNRLPDAIGGVEKRTVTRLEYRSRIKAISDRWAETRSTIQIAGEPDSSGAEVPISQEIFLIIDSLIHDHNTIATSVLDNALALFQSLDGPGSSEMLRPSAAQWRGSIDWFVSKAHDSGRVDADICTDTELAVRFERFEASLLALCRGFFENLGELDAILDEANR